LTHKVTQVCTAGVQVAFCSDLVQRVDSVGVVEHLQDAKVTVRGLGYDSYLVVIELDDADPGGRADLGFSMA
jgi:hypothetical protein